MHMLRKTANGFILAIPVLHEFVCCMSPLLALSLSYGLLYLFGVADAVVRLFWTVSAFLYEHSQNRKCESFGVLSLFF